MTRDVDPHPEPREDARDAYLWDRRGEPDPLVAALERALAPHRWRAPLAEADALDAPPASDAIERARLAYRPPDARAGGTEARDAREALHAGDAIDDARLDDGRRDPRARGARAARRARGARSIALDGRRIDAKPRVSRLVVLALAAAALLCAALLAWRGRPRGGGAGVAGVAGADAHAVASDRGAGYRVRVLGGAPRLDGALLDPHAAPALAPESAVETDQASRARVSVGDVGAVELHPGSRLRVGRPADAGDPAAGYVLHLERGALTASIFAAPRLFQLGTPSGLAVDLGCVYTARVDADGVTHLRVESGQVSFEAAGRRVLVPMGAATRAWPGAGPGTPVWNDAPEGFSDALRRFDERVLRDGEEPDLALLDEVLARARARDSLSLWHLLAHARAAVAPRVYERLAALAPPPAGVTREACLARSGDALDAWRDALGWAWPPRSPRGSPR